MGEEAPPSWKSKTHHQKRMNEELIITESDMEAAQQLIQLSDEDNSCNSNTISSGNGKIKSSRRRTRDEEEVDQIREIFGEEAFQPKKQRRYRSLVNIYMATTPVNA